MDIERSLHMGAMPWAESSFDPSDVADGETTHSDDAEALAEAGEQVVPVFCRPFVGHRQTKVGDVDRTAEIVTGDVGEWYYMTPFEQAQAAYQGFDNFGGGSVRDAEDTDYTPMLDPDNWRL